LDDGATFSPNARVTSALLDAGGAQVIGDYAGIAASGGYAHPVWVSGGVHFPPNSGDGVLQTATLKIPAMVKTPTFGTFVTHAGASGPVVVASESTGFGGPALLDPISSASAFAGHHPIPLSPAATSASSLPGLQPMLTNTASVRGAG